MIAKLTVSWRSLESGGGLITALLVEGLGGKGGGDDGDVLGGGIDRLG